MVFFYLPTYLSDTQTYTYILENRKSSIAKAHIHPLCIILCKYCFHQLHAVWSKIGKEKVLKWVETLLAQPGDSGPHISVTFSALCAHYKDIGDESIITLHKVGYCSI